LPEKYESATNEEGKYRIDEFHTDIFFLNIKKARPFMAIALKIFIILRDPEAGPF
jgi:hypothetical protein